MELDLATKADIDEIKDAITVLTILVKKLAKDSKSCEVVTVSDLCEMKGLSRTQLVSRMPYLMPNNGISDYPGKKRWNVSTLTDWEKIPVSERKESWEQIQRRKK